MFEKVWKNGVERTEKTESRNADFLSAGEARKAI